MDINIRILSWFQGTEEIREFENSHIDIENTIIYARTAEAIFDENELYRYFKIGFNDVGIND